MWEQRGERQWGSLAPYSNRGKAVWCGLLFGRGIPLQQIKIGLWQRQLVASLCHPVCLQATLAHFSQTGEVDCFDSPRHFVFLFFSHERAFLVGFSLFSFLHVRLHVFREARRSKTADSHFLRTNQVLLFPLFCKYSDRFGNPFTSPSLWITHPHLQVTWLWPPPSSPTVSTKLYECYYLRLSRSLPLPLWDTSADGPSSIPGSLLIAFVLFLQPVEWGSVVGSRAAVQQLTWRWLAPSGDAVAAGGIFNIFLLGNGVQICQIQLDKYIIVNIYDCFSQIPSRVDI